MDLLIPSTGLLFWMSLTFFVVLFILWKFGFPVITSMVSERKAFIDESLRKAHEANERLANIQKEGESILQEAREKQAQILKEAAETREAIVEQAQEKARQEGARLLDDARVAIEQEKKAAPDAIPAKTAQGSGGEVRSGNYDRNRNSYSGNRNNNHHSNGGGRNEQYYKLSGDHGV